jgi:outer membrane biosynthesis protein TonB
MREAVSDILEERAQLTGGMSRMVLVSLGLHLLLVASLIFAPGFWSIAVEREETPMMISLGGAEGPDSGGMNTISNRTIQREAAPEEKPNVTPPATKPPEMVLPEPKTAKPAPKTPAKPLEKPKEPSSARKESSGEKVASGAGRVETPNAPQVPFGGLTTGGGGTGGARVDVANFCCPAYLTNVVSIVKRNWRERQAITGQNIVKFVIHRDGRIDGIAVDESGGQLLDMASVRALSVTRQVSPLPREFTGNTLTVYLVFEYKR